MNIDQKKKQGIMKGIILLTKKKKELSLGAC